MAPLIRSILVVPEEGDPDNLLIDGEGGAKPPVAIFVTDGDCVGWVVRVDQPARGRKRKAPVISRLALILAWNGSVVVEGIDRLARRRLEDPAWLEGDIRSILDGTVTKDSIWSDGPLGNILLLDAEGREI